MNLSRYDRQSRISGWKQDSLSRASVLVVGAGALGNETIKNLALLGVGHLQIVDFDRIEISNLSRTVLFCQEDVGHSKAEVAAIRVRELNPQIDVQYLHGDVFFDVGLGVFRDATLVVGCLDNIAARARVGRSCALVGTPYLDGGMWELGGEVRWFLPGETACFECTMTETDRYHAQERWSCTGFKSTDISHSQVHPSTISTTSIIGGLLGQETTRMLCGWEVTGGEALVYNGLSRKMHCATLPRDPKCPFHSPYRDIIELDRGTATLTAADLLDMARPELGDEVVLELGRDFLRSLYCPRCEQTEEINCVVGRVDESRALCPKCGQARQPDFVSRISFAHELGSRTLTQLGIPPREIIALRNNKRTLLYELA